MNIEELVSRLIDAAIRGENKAYAMRHAPGVWDGIADKTMLVYSDEPHSGGVFIHEVGQA